LAEAYRIKGELLNPLAQVNNVEECFSQALKVAQAQGARLLELRAAMSLARLWRDQGKVQQARELLCFGLRVVYGRVRHARSEGGEGAAR
jgi:hypothetical protein